MAQNHTIFADANFSEIQFELYEVLAVENFDEKLKSS